MTLSAHFHDRAPSNQAQLIEIRHDFPQGGIRPATRNKSFVAHGRLGRPLRRSLKKNIHMITLRGMFDFQGTYPYPAIRVDAADRVRVRPGARRRQRVSVRCSVARGPLAVGTSRRAQMYWMSLPPNLAYPPQLQCRHSCVVPIAPISSLTAATYLAFEAL
jgi:hypothetical protein